MEPQREELQRMYFEAENYKRQLEGISAQIQVLEAAMAETEAAINALDSLREAKKGDEILVPIGSGSFIKGEIKDKESVIIGIGAGISVEKKVGDAKKILDKRQKDMQGAMEKMRNGATQANKKLMELNSKSEAIIREIQAGEQKG
ncbi:MAG: prefoldin subunit alpha [Candidatus Altiarchaeales archaeon]|nr:prefoldin subunit alpha [Candidatus Altiarchaeota archaeon]MCG2783016.1 prefoldin subunit alpha [Candidatus Altiarchaeales archaeon]MBU4265836.1 prefoldin subunit alpha [Candidatus Altiarchaeota archaeon]MBU4342003.1 prefoldin subunit alpha [Candidatus Altiarchaeota archaeon]MBU4406207.1 prefoldin subunit alpha [Candidatus Altiarchaeota archaeon]